MTTNAKGHQECGATYQRTRELTARCTYASGHEGAHYDDVMRYGWPQHSDWTHHCAACDSPGACEVSAACLGPLPRSEWACEKEKRATAPGAPQSGGMSGVAAQPGEGALARKHRAWNGDEYTMAELRERFPAMLDAAMDEVSAICGGGKWRMCVPAHREDSDIVISGALHAARVLLTAPAPSSPRAEAPEAEPADAAALERDVKSVEAAFVWPTYDAAWEALDRLANRALRRAAPGAAPEAAPEREAMESALRAARAVLDSRLYLAETFDDVAAGVVAQIDAALRATPAPTGERAGGETGR